VENHVLNSVRCTIFIGNWKWSEPDDIFNMESGIPMHIIGRVFIKLWISWI